MKHIALLVCTTALLLGCESSSDGPIAPTDSDDDRIAALPAPQLPTELLSYETPMPEHLRVPVLETTDNTPADNPITDAGATLGRVLFYDKRLSRNGEVSCASCHDQSAGFSDPRRLSLGFEGGATRRNSMSLVNLRHFPDGSMFWDQRAGSLEEQVLMPIQDEVEMGLTLDLLIERVAGAEYYPSLFAAAFGDPVVTEDRVSRSLSQFVRSIVSYDSPFDEGVAATGDLLLPFPNFTDEENRGKAIFFGDHDTATPGLCGNCHMFANPTMVVGPGGPPPGGVASENLGIFHQRNPTNNGFTDPTDDGVGEVTGDPAQAGTFKVSSLRNVELTAPYMHDGRFTTLEAVVNHYSDGVQLHPNLGPGLLTPPMGPNPPMPIRLNLSAADKAALVAFMETLTDPSMANDVRWSDPFGG